MSLEEAQKMCLASHEMGAAAARMNTAADTMQYQVCRPFDDAVDRLKRIVAVQVKLAALQLEAARDHRDTYGLEARMTQLLDEL